MGAKLLPYAGIKDGGIDPSCEAVEHHLHVGQSIVKLIHIATHHHVRQAAGGGEGLNILRRRLHLSFDPDLHFPIKKNLAGLGPNLD